MAVSDISNQNYAIHINEYDASCDEHCVQQYLSSWQWIFANETTSFSASPDPAIGINFSESSASFAGESGTPGLVDLVR